MKRSDKISIECLKASGWSVEGAVEYYYSSGIGNSSSVDKRSLEALFKKYKDPNDDVILDEGIGRLFDDLGVSPMDIVVLVLSYHMNAAIMCEYTKEEFSKGLTSIGVDSMDKLRKRLPDLRAELKDEAKFRDIYTYAYQFSRERGQKCVQLETAVAMWKLIFAEDRHWPLIDDWCEFLQTHHNRAISKDTWTQLFEFSRAIQTDFSNFDENGAWPYLLDEFVDYMKEKNNEMHE